MNERADEMYLAASLYYVQDETMESIARQLNMSRSTVSRLLKQARECGLVKITLSNPAGPSNNLAQGLERAFGVRAHVVPVSDVASNVTRLERVARAAGRVISEAVGDDMVIGAAWGTTLSSVVEFLQPTPTQGATIIQMNGAANPSGSGIGYVGGLVSQFAKVFNASFVPFPVPALFDHAETKQAMWRERSVRHVLTMQQRMDLAVFGIGGLLAEVPSHVYTAGYLDEEDMRQLHEQRVVGDVNTVFLREDGSWADIPMNDRASGMPLNQLRRIPRRIGVVAGAAKAAPLLGALRARVMTDVVVDESTAAAVLARL